MLTRLVQNRSTLPESQLLTGRECSQVLGPSELACFGADNVKLLVIIQRLLLLLPL